MWQDRDTGLMVMEATREMVKCKNWEIEVVRNNQRDVKQIEHQG